MPHLADDFNFGSAKELDVSEELLRAMEEAYEETSAEVNRKCDLVVKTVAPSGTPDASGHIPSTVDVNYRNGTVWIKNDGATGPITAQVFIKVETIISGGNKTALWSRLV